MFLGWTTYYLLCLWFMAPLRKLVHVFSMYIIKNLTKWGNIYIWSDQPDTQQTAKHTLAESWCHCNTIPQTQQIDWGRWLTSDEWPDDESLWSYYAAWHTAEIWESKNQACTKSTPFWGSFNTNTRPIRFISEPHVNKQLFSLLLSSADSRYWKI